MRHLPNYDGKKIFKTHPNKNNVLFKNVKCLFSDADRYTVKLGIKELLNKKQTGFKELFTDYQPFYTINLLLNKELWQSKKWLALVNKRL